MSQPTAPRVTTAKERFRRDLTRAVLPRLLLRLTRARRGIRARVARVQRAFGSSPRIELYFAFDDPYSAVAVTEMARLSREYGAELVVYPVLEHGIPSDPDLPLRRAYAVTDADRLLRRTGQRLARKTELDPKEVHFLAAWTEEARTLGASNSFATEAIAELWLSEEGPVNEERYRKIYERTALAPPPSFSPFSTSSELDARLVRNAAQLRSRGHWETPAARVSGEWFFAHERVAQIADLLAHVTG